MLQLFLRPSCLHRAYNYGSYRHKVSPKTNHIARVQNIKSQLKAQAQKEGAAQLGIAQARPLNEAYNHYQNWIDKGHAADLWYLTESVRKEKRQDPRLIMPHAKTIWVAAFNYKPRAEDEAESQSKAEAKFARYGWGQDYHKFVKKRLKRLVHYAQTELQLNFDYKIYVDTGPILERAYAEAAGVGFIGKNSCLINTRFGSYTYLGCVLTDLDVPLDQPTTAHCGTCTRCLDACPTDAFDGPYQLNANKCISYHTIENRSERLPGSIQENLNDWVAGCDICQEVCPWNRKSPETELPECAPRDFTRLDKEGIQSLDTQAHEKLFQGSAFKRISLPMLQRNVE